MDRNNRRRSALAAAIVLALTLGLPALASAEPVLPVVKLQVPAIARMRAPIAVTGTVSGISSPGEPVRFTLQHATGRVWTTLIVINGAMGDAGTFGATLSASPRGYWRVYAAIDATMGHVAATSTPMPIHIVGSKVVALTFDDGPWNASTDKILSILNKYDAHATFFMLGSQIGGQAARAKRVSVAGNTVGVHSWNHAIMVRRSDNTNAADLRRCIAAVKSATGKTPKWFRPPYGSTNSSLKQVAANAGLRQVIWTVDTLDWKIRTVNSVKSRALAGTRDGGVVLMHDGGGNRTATAGALPGIITTLRARGYDFCNLDEMATLGYKPH